METRAFLSPEASGSYGNVFFLVGKLPEVPEISFSFSGSFWKFRKRVFLSREASGSSGNEFFFLGKFPEVPETCFFFPAGFRKFR